MDEPPSSPGDLLGLAKYAGTLFLAAGGSLGTNGGTIESWMLPAILILFMLSFLFSGLEAAFFSFGRYRLRELCAKRHSRAVQLSKLFTKPERLISILIISNITANVILAGLWTKGAFQLAEAAGVGHKAWFIGVAEAILVILLVLFAEITPKILFTKYSESISLAFTPFMFGMCRVVGPIGALLEGTAYLLLLPFKGAEKAKNHSVTEEEIIDIVTVGESEGVIDEHEKEMIHSIFEFGDRQVREVMVPRTDVVAVEAGTGLKEAMGVVVSSGFSRIPIYERSVDSIIGILMAKDFLPLIGRGDTESAAITDLMRKSVYFIPETKLVGELFKEFQQRKIHMAVAVDEHGGTAGVITLEDMLEEIVGEITDEYDIVEPVAQRQSDGSYILEGKFGLHELEELYDLDMENEDYDTVGGLILAKLGSIPEVGQIAEDGSLRFEVLEVAGNRVTKLKVWQIPEASGLEDSE